MNLLLCILFILFLLFVRKIRVIDSFTISPHNAYKVPNNPIETIYEEETKRLNSLLASKNILDTIPDTRSFAKIPHYTEFHLNSSFKTLVKKHLSDTLGTSPHYKKTTFNVLRDVYDVYFTENPASRQYVFSVDVSNLEKAFARRFDVVVSTQFDSMILQHIGTSSLAASTIEGIQHNKQDNQLQITNTLFLLGPFKTNDVNNIQN